MEININLSNPNVKELIAFINDYNTKTSEVYSKEKEMNISDLYGYNKQNKDSSSSIINKSDNN